MAMTLTNEEIAETLDQIAELLSAQDANPFRVMAYRRAAGTLRELTGSIEDILEVEGIEGVKKLPGIGESLSRIVAEIVETGSSGLLERLRGRSAPEDLFSTVPGIGKELANRIHERLGIESLEELEQAAHDGRLAEVPGFGPRRLRGTAEALAGRLGRRSRRVSDVGAKPPVSEILDVDGEYREKAAAQSLRMIAPRRFNPEGKAWLPILHTDRDHRHYTALFSNTARAHELNKTHDWVVIYFDDGRNERQATVVTETRGPLTDRRVVRGREAECLDFYATAPVSS
jgi:DNA polymerase/3'-5' exonuclease PolX